MFLLPPAFRSMARQPIDLDGVEDIELSGNGQRVQSLSFFSGLLQGSQYVGLSASMMVLLSCRMNNVPNSVSRHEPILSVLASRRKWTTCFSQNQ